MTNLEKHRKDFEYHLRVMMTNECENLIKTAGMHCSCECNACCKKFVDWLLDEAPVDWSQVESGTTYLVRDNENDPWVVREFAVFAFEKPWFFSGGSSIDNMTITTSLQTYNYCKLKED